MNKKVAVALSGGVDSSVVAWLLKKQGYDVIGVTAKTTPNSDVIVEKAFKVAEKLGIPFFALDVTEDFDQRVIKYFENSYKCGETPNPCIMCNKYIKWGVLYDYAINELGADYIATGHYANIKEVDEIFKLYPASDEHKDQLYFLFALNQEQLKHTLFPLSAYKKDGVRKMAYDNDLPSKSSKESQDICFIQAPMTTKKYLMDKIENKGEGNFVEKSTGKILGKHGGFWQYTIGQRKGIGIAAPEPLYVTGIKAETNTVFVGYKDDLFSDTLILNDFEWSYPVEKKNFRALVKIRYNMKAVEADIEVEENRLIIRFAEPVSAIAKGQACVLYDLNDGHLLGGTFI